jgi:hypothetical protein
LQFVEDGLDHANNRLIVSHICLFLRVGVMKSNVND